MHSVELGKRSQAFLPRFSFGVARHFAFLGSDARISARPLALYTVRVWRRFLPATPPRLGGEEIAAGINFAHRQRLLVGARGGGYLAASNSFNSRASSATLL